MNAITGLNIFLFVLFFCWSNVAADEHIDIDCPSCDQLELRSAKTNQSDPCHDYYDYVCHDASLLPDLTGHRTRIMPRLPLNHSTTLFSSRTELMAKEIELTCPFNQLVNHTFNWKRNGILVSKIVDLEVRSSLADNGSLLIKELHFDDTGIYTCEVFRGTRRIKSSNTYLNVEFPAMVKRAPKTQYMIAGKKSVVKCYVAANPAFQFITWTKNENPFNLNATGVSIVKNGSLLFENPNKEDEGLYRCTPYNIHGTQGPSKLMQVYVKEKFNKFAEYDARVEEAHNETIQRNAENLFTQQKHFKSRVMKVTQTRAKSELVLKGVNDTHADVKMINHTIINLFSKQRNEFFDLPHKEMIRKAVIQVFQSYSLNTEIQKFKFRHFDFNKFQYMTLEAKNLIGILPSLNFQKPGDRIFVIGAHYDTVCENPGVDDNGSGSTYVLEAARLLSKHKETLNATIYFVLFDQEETGLDGSNAFVNEYLIPKVIDKNRAVYVGAYLADMVLLYDSNEDVQILPGDMQRMCPEAWNWISNNSFRGDFMSLWGRKAETTLWQTFKESWDEIPNNPFKVLLINSPMADNYNNFTLSQMLSTFTRSDHASFWSSANSHSHISTLPAALLTDMGPWRGYQRMCYHQPCDNEIQLTETNLKFMAHAVDAVIASVIKLVGVSQPNGNSILN